MTVAPHHHLNRVLEAAMERTAQLEAQLARVLQPILEDAGNEAAHNFEALATDFLTADAHAGVRQVRPRAGRAAAAETPLRPILRASDALTAATPGVTSSSTMICVKPPPDEAAMLAVEGGDDPDTLHVTLAYLGDVEGDLTPIVEALTPVGANHAVLSGTVAGSGTFKPAPDQPAPSILLPDVPGLVELRVAVTEALAGAGIDYSRLHGFEAHITLEYVTPGDDLYRPDLYGLPLTFTEVLVVRGDIVEARIPLVGPKPLTAAGWKAPAGDEMLDVDKLVKTLRTKTDPVRLAAIENVAKTSLEGIGLSYDVTHPLIGNLLAQSGSQITHIAQSTQLNVMRIVGRSEEEGLTIRDTAKAIQAGMSSASQSRATLIARTEMVGAVNGASVAATTIASEELGISYQKEWLTAEGAVNPRHEEYDGLNGQTVPLDAMFDVGGTQLEYPGDPGGPPEEVCNCRCSLVYIEGEPKTNPVDAPDSGGGGGLGYAPDIGGGEAAEVLYDAGEALTRVEETSSHVVAESQIPETKVAKVAGRSENAYIASLQEELYSTNNVISYMNRKVKAGTATTEDAGRLEALRKRKEDIRSLIATPDPKGELSRVRNQLNYMKRRVREGNVTAETTARIKLLEARAEALTSLTKGSALKVQKEAKVAAKKVEVVTEEKSLVTRLLEGAQERVDAEKVVSPKALNYSSANDLQYLLRDTPSHETVVIPPHEAVQGGGYTYHAGQSVIWKGEGGVVFKYETPFSISEGRIKEMQALGDSYIKDVPESMRYNLETVSLYQSSNPADEFWAKEFKMPGFTSSATGGHGQINFWHADRTFLKQSVFDHEMGHVVGSWGGPIDVIEWNRAQVTDKRVSAKVKDLSGGQHHKLTPGTGGVTDYGQNNLNEDWAESVRLFLQSRRQGSIATARKPDGLLTPVKFEDVYPARARIIAREFPG